MGAENFVKSEVASERSALRSRVLLMATLRTPKGETKARLRDLSRKGALVECSVQPPVDSEVTFVRGPLEVPARVAWTAGTRIGLEFLYMIDEKDALVKLGESPSGPDYGRYRKPLLGERMTRQQRKLAEAWGITVGLTVPEDC